MTILKRLKAHASEKVKNIRGIDVRIGFCYTAVLLDNGSAGVAFTFRDEIPPGCLFREKPLAGEEASHVIEGITSSDLLERTVGIAAANALLNEESDDLIGGDTLEVISPKEDDIVGMVGYFGPFVPILRQRVKELRIFEKVPQKAEGLYPEKMAYELLPSCTIAIITSTSIINKTFEPLAEAAKNCRKVALVGSSTPLAKEVFEPYGIDLLSGIVITKPKEILRVVSECGGTRHFKGYVKKVNAVYNTCK
jgi:uncharacterized protein (DUF4213/DUF364 family)